MSTCYMLTLSGFNFIRTGETICPDELKRRSEGELVAQMHRNLLANTARDGSTNLTGSLQNPALEW